MLYTGLLMHNQVFADSHWHCATREGGEGGYLGVKKASGEPFHPSALPYQSVRPKHSTIYKVFGYPDAKMSQLTPNHSTLSVDSSKHFMNRQVRYLYDTVLKKVGNMVTTPYPRWPHYSTCRGAAPCRHLSPPSSPSPSNAVSNHSAAN